MSVLESSKSLLPGLAFPIGPTSRDHDEREMSRREDKRARVFSLYLCMCGDHSRLYSDLNRIGRQCLLCGYGRVLFG